MNKHELILATFVAAGENTTFSPVQVQKLFFIIDRELEQFIGGPYFNFIPYDYGPYDKEVYSTLDNLSRDGLIEINHAGHYRRYRLTDQGFSKGREVLEQIDEPSKSYLLRLTEWIKTLNFQQIVSAVYKKYPEMRKNSVFFG